MPYLHETTLALPHWVQESQKPLVVLSNITKTCAPPSRNKGRIGPSNIDDGCKTYQHLQSNWKQLHVLPHKLPNKPLADQTHDLKGPPPSRSLNSALACQEA